MIVFNIFASVGSPELLCAAPQDHPVPQFVRGPQWCFFAALTDDELRALSCCESAVALGTRLNGFYLFQAAKIPSRQGILQSGDAGRPITLRGHVGERRNGDQSFGPMVDAKTVLPFIAGQDRSMPVRTRSSR